MNEENQENLENVRTCADCRAIIEEGCESYETHNGDILCQDCYENDYFYCEDCEEIHHNDELIVIDNGANYVCEDCASNNYNQCVHCDEWHDPSNGGITNVDGEYVCESCADSYYYCESCNEYVHGDDMHYIEEEDGYICDSCYSDYERENESRLYSYHEFSNWKMYKKESEGKPPFYIGFELEVQPKDGSTDKQKDALDSIYNNLNAICSRDGSLGSGGFEIVSHPQTMQYITENQEKLRITFNKLIELGYTSHDNNQCGLHFHITRPTNDEVIDRIWLIMETYKKEIMLLSRRTSSQISRWAQFLSDYTHDKSENMKALYYLKKTDKTDSRYLALNNRNDKTIEFRFFKGTLNFNTFMSALEFINNLMTLCSNLEISIERITWDRLCHGKYIKKYVTDKKIKTDTKPKDKSLKLIRKENAQKGLMVQIDRLLMQYARQLLTENTIKTTNLKDFKQFADTSKKLKNYYNELNSGIYDTLRYMQNDEEHDRVTDYISRLEYLLSYYMRAESELKEKIRVKYNKLKEINEKEI